MSPLRCNILEIPGDPIGSTDRSELAAPVFRLSRLGFLRAFNGGGFINEGDDGSDDLKESMLGRRLRARLLGFLGLRGDGDVIGRSSLIGTRRGPLSTIFKCWKESRPNVDPENDESGTSVTGDSGDELGEGSDNDAESIVEIVVVGDESVESEVCVDVLSRC